MRIHVGQHILKDSSENHPSLCGFCGKSTCSVNLVNTSKKNNEKKYKVSSTCEYIVNFNLKSAEKLSDKMPCCNHPVWCPYEKPGKDGGKGKKCTRAIWLYNIQSHYQIDHN